MKKDKTILLFLSYSPKIYSGFDKFNILLAQKLIKNGFTLVFIFNDSVDEVLQLKMDIISSDVIIESIPSHFFKRIKSIWLLFQKYKPTIIHSHFVNSDKLVSAVFSQLYKSKYFVTFHSSIYSDSAKKYKIEKGIFKRYLLFIFYRLLIVSSKNIFAVSDSIKNQFLNFSISHSRKVQRLYLGVSLKTNEIDKSELRSQLGLPQEKILLCNVSSFENIKGIDTILKAMALLKQKYKLTNISFCHIGGLRTDSEDNYNYKKYIYSLVKKCNLHNEVIWLGRRFDMPDILSAFDIYVHPSRMEGIGMANMEAAVHKLPIVATNVGGIPEIVINNLNGFLFHQENSEQLADCLYRLISDKNLRIKMGENSYTVVSENFNIETQTEYLMNIYLKSIS